MLLQARLPREKIEKCVSLISDFRWHKKVALREIQSLTGLLNFACSVIEPGRAFLHRLIDLTLNRKVKEDLNLWLSFLSEFNGTSVFLEDGWFSSNTLSLYIDASGALGFGAFFGQHWCYDEWPDGWARLNIAILEFYPIVLSLYLWGLHMSNKNIFFTGNEALVHVINKQSCKDKVLMTFVRCMVLHKQGVCHWRVIGALPQFSCSAHYKSQFCAMCALAFHAFLRIGEMTAPRVGSPPLLQLSQLVQMVDPDGTVRALTFYNYKHCYNQPPPFSIEIQHQSRCCPVELLMDYIAHRGHIPG